VTGTRLVLVAAVAVVAAAQIGLIVIGRPRKPTEVLWIAVPAIGLGLLLWWAWRVTGA
jgi:hypothetical protein